MSFVDGLHEKLQRALKGSDRIALVTTDAADDCGLACLSMVLQHHGQSAPVPELRKQLGPMTGGANLAQIATLARRRGLVPNGYQIDLDALHELAPGTILHWDMDHFVVLGRTGRKGFEILDPASSSRWMTQEEVGEHFTGIVLTLEKAADFKRRRDDEDPLRPFVGMVSQHRGLLAGAIQASIVLHLLGFAVPIAFALVVEEVIPWSRADALLLMTIALCLTAVGQLLTHLIRGRVLALLSVRSETSMQGQFFHRLLHLPDEILSAHTSGDLLQRGYSLHELRSRVSDIFLSTLLDAVTALLFFVSLVFISPGCAAWIAALGLVKALWAAVMRPMREQRVASYLRAESELYSQQVEMVGMLESIKSMGREGDSLNRWSANFTDKCRAELERDNLRALMSAVHAGTATLVPAIVVGVAGSAAMAGDLSVGSLFAVSALAPGFMGPLTSMIGAVEELSSARSIARRVNQVMEAELEEAEDKKGACVTLGGAVELDDVAFEYVEGRAVVDGVSIDIQAGEMVAIVGPTGSGKSTLVKLLTGLRTPSRGCVRLDGCELERLDFAHTRRQLGLVPQRVQLMRGSVRDNIAFGLDVSDEDIEWAATVAGIHERIVSDPYGYDAPLSEGGSSLSGGEAQRLAIARAIVARPRLLILDEATSALDAETEARVHEGLAALGCTKIIIAHRLSTIRNADRIVVMDAGRIVEQDSHKALMSKRGFYARLVAAQEGQGEVAA